MKATIQEALLWLIQKLSVSVDRTSERERVLAEEHGEVQQEESRASQSRSLVLPILRLRAPLLC